jgi:hypothetical protein
VEHILLTDSADQIRQLHVDYVVVGGLELALKGTTIEAWLQRTGGQLVATTTATVKVAEGPQSWYLVRFPG